MHRYVLARTFYTGEIWNEAKSLFDDLSKEFPDNLQYKGYLGGLAVRQGDLDKAEYISQELETMDRPHLFGGNLCWLASMVAARGDKPRAIQLLREALARRYNLFTAPLQEQIDFSLHCEMNFESLRDDPDFQELIRPKG